MNISSFLKETIEGMILARPIDRILFFEQVRRKELRKFFVMNIKI